MSSWRRLKLHTWNTAHLSAAGITLLFAIPLATSLAIQNSETRQAQGRKAELHVDSISQRVAKSIARTQATTGILSDALRNYKPEIFSATLGNAFGITGPDAIFEITPDNIAPLVITRRGDSIDARLSQILTSQPISLAPTPLGDPTIGFRGQQLVFTQALISRSGEGRTRFWGYLSIRTTIPALTQTGNFRELAADGLAIRVQHLIDNQIPGSILFDSNNKEAPALARKDISLPGNGSLRFDVIPLDVATSSGETSNWLFLLAGCIAFYLSNLKLLRRPAILKQEVERRTQQLDQEKAILEQEISNRKDAESMLERSHRLLDSIFEHIPGMIILKRASDKRVARINRSGEDILGRSRQSLIGRSNDEIYDPDLANRLNQSDEQVATGTPQIEHSLELLRMPGQDNRWIRLRKILLRNIEGRPEYILEFAEDVSERESLDLRLREHLHFLEQLIDAIPGPLYFKDTKGRYIGINSAFERYIGINRSDISGKTVFDISSYDRAHQHHHADNELMERGNGSQIYEATVRNADGLDREVVFHKAVYHQTDGNPGGIVGILLDITERKQAEQKVIQLNRLLTLLSDTNQAIVRIQDPTRLLEVVAELLLESGKFPVAWIHLHDQDKIYLSSQVSDNENVAREITAMFSRASEKSLSNPIYINTADGFESYLTKELASRRLRAYAELPIHQLGQKIGSIGILDASIEVFDSDNRRLIEDLANNISYALESMHAQAQRRAAEEQLELAARVFENSTEGIIITDAGNRILIVNKAFSSVTGYTPDEVIGKTPSLLSSGRQAPAFYSDLWQSLQENGEWQGEIENRRKNGEIYPEWLNISVAKQDDGSVSNYVAIFSDLTKRKEIEGRLAFLAQFDPLTELPNRLQFHNDLQHAIEQARTQRKKIALLTLDLDRFKIINDTFGHTAGDQLLIEAANRLRDSISPGDTLCRLGGDEFAIILSNIASISDVTSFATHAQANLRRSMFMESHEIHLSTSIGISLFPDDASTMEGLISNADSAMYAAIELGGNTFRFYQQEMNASSAERMRIESRLHHALERGELAVYFQPLVCSKSGQIAGAEALLRWHSEELGPIRPDVFIPLMEETKLIIPIGLWVLKTACEENRRWRHAGQKDMFVAVNLSAVQLAEPELVGNIERILSETQFDPRFLEIELTESAVMRDADAGIRTLNQLKTLGVQISIDDFGTGYSSLSYLKQLPLDTLKIDRSFVIDAVDNKNASAIIRAIVAMGHTLDFHIIAEGIESIGQVDLLRDVSVDYLQGYYFSRPIPASQFSELLRRTPSFSLIPAVSQSRPALRPVRH